MGTDIAPPTVSRYRPLRAAPLDVSRLRSGGAMFVAVSRFTIANDMSESVREAFRTRPHLVDTEPGFVAMHVMSPIDNPQEIWLVTHWKDEASYRSWHHGHTFHQSHSGIPKGLKLVPRETEIRFFRTFAY